MFREASMNILIGIVFAASVILDQVTKMWAVNALKNGRSIKIVGNFLRFTYAENRGAAFSILQNQRMLFIIVTIILMAVLAYIYFKSDNITKLSRLAIAMIAGGAIGNFIDRVVMFRRQFAQEIGMVVPSVRLRDNGYLNPNEYSIKLKGEEVAKGEILVEYYLALDPGDLTGEVDGIETIEPAYGIPSRWITKDKKELAEIYGYTVIDPLSVLITHLSEVIKTHAHELLSRQDLNQLLSNMKKINESLVEEVVPGIVSHGNLQKILGNLLKEGIPIKDLETILETISDYGTSVKDTEMLTEYVRQSLKRTITRKWAEGGQIRVITLSTDVEKLIINAISKNDRGSFLSIDPELMQKLVTQLIEQINKLKGEISVPIILTSPFVRGYFRKLLDQFYPKAVVLSFNEIDNSVQIQALGNIAI
ncbi:MAG TPA: hypothetical protein DCM73_16835 [Clostridiales bacterium]|nr:hypothetical protein [Clostridiales bacterium]